MSTKSELKAEEYRRTQSTKKLICLIIGAASTILGLLGGFLISYKDVIQNVTVYEDKISMNRDKIGVNSSLLAHMQESINTNEQKMVGAQQQLDTQQRAIQNITNYQHNSFNLQLETLIRSNRK